MAFLKMGEDRQQDGSVSWYQSYRCWLHESEIWLLNKLCEDCGTWTARNSEQMTLNAVEAETRPVWTSIAAWNLALPRSQNFPCGVFYRRSKPTHPRLKSHMVLLSQTNVAIHQKTPSMIMAWHLCEMNCERRWVRAEFKFHSSVRVWSNTHGAACRFCM